MNKKYSTLLFDLDDTLLDFGKSEDNAITKVFESYNIPCTPENKQLYSDHNKSLWKAFERGEITREQLFKVRFTELFRMMNIDADGIKANSEFVSYIAQDSYLIDGALEVCEKLHREYKMYLITNGAVKAQRGRLKDSPLTQYFDGIFISEEIGFVKPQREFFDCVFSKIEETDKSKVLVIGDSLTSDIKGAVDYGIDSCWVRWNSKAENPATFSIGNITEILSVLE
ncbi:MAG: YjjG family noncanonical pyrimidine nucleotidase [Clostridia bacterium]|nr:YjjG family noncanonical pyrimidine nucleotidase [Clostridia bacterium]